MMDWKHIDYTEVKRLGWLFQDFHDSFLKVNNMSINTRYKLLI